MARRFFTADFHLGMSDIIRFEKRPFKDINEMNAALIDVCRKKAKLYVEVSESGERQIIDRDTIIHVGDLACFNNDRGNMGLKINPQRLISQIPANFVNLRGNHDINNKVKSIGNYLRTTLGKKYLDVSVSHYPSYDERAIGTFIEGDIHICGHVHGKWKHCLDLTNKVLNINVGVDAWNYSIVSEDELIEYIDKVRRMKKDDLTRVIKASNGQYLKV